MCQHTHVSYAETNAQTWEPRFCLQDWCEVTRVFVRRDPANAELWHVVIDDDTAYLVAATRPICPICASHLLTVTNLSDGVEDNASAN
jgi:hypothetical protein